MRILIAFISCFLFSVLPAQEPVFRNYSLKDGLPSTEAHHVISAANGFLWIATDAGIAEFDGYSFKVFSVKNGLPESAVFKLYEDRKGRVWFATVGSRVGYIFNDSVVTLPQRFRKPGDLPNASFIASFYVDVYDTLWIGTEHSALLYRLAPPYDQPPQLREIGDNYRVLLGEDGQVFGTKDLTGGGLLYGKKAGGTFRFDTLRLSGGQNEYYRAYVRVNDDLSFWSIHDELYRVDKNGVHFFRKFPETICNLFTDASGALWVTEMRNGVYWYKDPLQDAPPEQFFADYTITSGVTDFEGGCWFTTLEQGLMYVPSFTFCGTRIPGVQINSLFLFGTGGIAAQTFFGPLYLLMQDSIRVIDTKSTSLFSVPSAPGKLFFAEPLQMHCGYIDPLTGDVHYFCDEKHPRAATYFKSYREGPGGSLHAVGTYLLFRLDTATMTCQRMLAVKERINDFAVDRAGTFWLGTAMGLYSYTEKDSLRYWGKRFPELAVSINRMEKDTTGNLWLATRGNGLIVFKDNRIVRILHECDGLPSDFCRMLYVDAQNNVWAVINNGLCRISGPAFTVTAYPFLDRFLAGNINDVARRDNTIYVGTSQGVYSFDLDAMEQKSRGLSPPVFIRSVTTARGKRVDAGTLLPYEENSVMIAFSGLSYFSSDELRYAYRLEGFDTTWRYTENLSAEYLQLPPGAYRFVVKTTGGNKYASIRFTIAAPYWMSSWFLLLCSGAFVALLYSGYRLRIAQVRRQEQLKTEQQVLLASMEARALRAQMNPHFVFNAMNSIQHFILKNDRRSAQHYLVSFARLIRNILDFSRTDFILLRNEIETLDLYVGLEQLRSGNKFDYRIVVEEGIPSTAVYVPSMLIQPVVENAIIHGLAPLEERRGLLKIVFTKQAQQLTCEVEDNGVGRAKAQEIKAGKPQSHHSIGVSVTQERLDALKKIHRLDAFCRVDDLYDASGVSCGTRVVLTFPFKNQL